MRAWVRASRYSGPQMALSSLSLTQFRNHEATRLQAGARFNVIWGDNGAGKTNILEAISLLAPGRGMRRADIQQMARQQGPGGFSVAAALMDDEVRIGTGTSADSPSRRQVRVNGASAAANSLADWLAVVWLTPAMDRLFLESAGGRRRFLDRLVLALHPAHARHAARYEAAMRERNRLLGGDRPADPGWIDALEARMAEHGAAMAFARADTLDALEFQIGAIETGPFAQPALALERKGPVEADALAAALRSGRSRDAAAGRALAGPHRDDLIVTMRQKGQPAALCSTGEQKAMLIAIILAHADLVAERRGSRLILLLDEVAAHLDPARRAALYEQLADRSGQVWMTGTDAALFDAVPLTGRADWSVSGGVVTADDRKK
ncbi:MAG: DNA repair protein RecF [Blastomonas sp. CACIA14H2]|nr:MAG: DNA repair protein RecF [Blastomonas sp. CACIA14H2]